MFSMGHKRGFLIVGANGFIGRHLLSKLAVRKDAIVRCLARKPSKELRRLCEDVRIGDLRDKDSIKGVADDIDVVFHLATTGNINAMSKKAYGEYRINNVEGTRNLLEECAESGVKRFVHFSSVAVYGNMAGGIVTEKTLCRPVTPYQKTKYESEQLVLEYCRRHKIKIIVLRPSTVYGEWDRSDMRRLNKMIRLGVVPMIGEGRNLVHMVHVDDLAETAIKAAETDRKAGVYLINTESLALNDIIDTLGKSRRFIKLRVPFSSVKTVLRFVEPVAGKFGFTLPITLSRIESFSSDTRLSAKLAEKELDFRPEKFFKDHIY